MDTSQRMMLDAVTALTDQIRKLQNYLEGQEEKAQKATRDIPIREKQAQEAWAAGEQGDLFDRAHQQAGRTRRRKVRRSPQDETLFDQRYGPTSPLPPTAPSPYASSQRPMPKDHSSPQRPMPPEEEDTRKDWVKWKEAYRDQRSSVGRFKSALGALASFGTQIDTGTNQGANASRASAPTQQTVNSVLGGWINPQDQQQQEANSMLSWALLGEHGGPAWARNLALERYGLQRTIDWSSNIAQGIQNTYQGDSVMGKVLQKIPGINDTSMGALNGFLGLAKNHPNMAFGTYLAYRGAQQGFANMRNNQAVGQSLGYGPPGLGQTIFGFHNPLGDFSAASRVGAAASLETQALEGRIPGYGFGSGLSKVQSQETMSTLLGQGWGMQPLGGHGFVGSAWGDLNSAISSIPVIGGPLAGFLSGILGGGPHGDAATIAQNFFEPLMQKYPGLSAQELGAFTPALRNSGTSIQQLTTQLQNLGMEARTTKETLNEYTSSLAQTGQAFENMGSSPQGGYAIGTGFTNTTGLDPQLAAQFAQSPIFQGLMMSQYGVLPSGLGDMNSGAFSGGALSTLKMLQQATSGLNRNVYKTVNGQQVLIESGNQAQIDQIAQMSGLPSNIVKRMLGDQRGIAARTNAQQLLGDATNGTGFYQFLDQHKGKLNKQEYQAAEQRWKKTVGYSWKGTGISEQEMHRIDAIKGMRERANAYSKALANASKNDNWNQLQNNPNSQTVQVQFTGAAAKFFQQVPGPSQAKRNANAGGINYASIVNAQQGDISSPPGNIYSQMNGGG